MSCLSLLSRIQACFVDQTVNCASHVASAPPVAALPQRRSSWLCCAVIALGLAVGACSGSSTASNVTGSDAGPDGAASDAGLDSAASDADVSTPPGFCEQYFALVQAKLSTCSVFTLTGIHALYDSPLICQRFNAAVADGRLAYDATHASACLQALESAPCDLSIGNGCDGVVTPKVPIGGTCKNLYLFSFQECDGGHCSLAADGCTGTCVAATTEAALNEPCSGPDATPCGDGLYCEGSTITTAGVCRAEKTSGACTSSTQCALPTHCTGPDGAMTCSPFKTTGEACTPGYRECTLFGYCADDGRCTETLAQSGETCGTLASGESVGCDVGLYCDAPIGSAQTGACQPEKVAGEACGGDAALVECSGNGAHCDAATSTCAVCPL